MNSRMGYALGIALALVCGTAMAQEIRWAPDVATARRAALEYRVPLLIHFYGDNCLPCKLLEQNVLSRKEVVETLNKYFICARVNGSQDRRLAAEYGVHSWPTDVFLGPDGKPLDQGVCKQSPGEYLSVLHNMAVLNRDRNVLLAAQQIESAKQVTSQVANYSQSAQQYAQSAQPAANNVAAQVNSIAGALPAAGIAPAGNPNGPNFYMQGTGTGQQQLPSSLAANASVTSGPMLSQNQPQAITTAVNAAGSQIVGAALTHTPSATAGMLPPFTGNTQTPQVVHPANVNPMHTMVAGAPSVPAGQSTVRVGNPTWHTAASTSTQVTSGTSQLVDNPHFASAPPLPGMPGAPMAPVNTQAGAPPFAQGATPNLPTPQMPSMQMPSMQMPSMQMAQAANIPNASPQLTLPVNNPIATQPPATTAKVPASTVSFQPRAALSVEANRAAVAMQPSAVTSSQSSTATTNVTVPAAALDGYCPVALKTQADWIKGQPQFAVKHRGRIYYLSSQQAMQDFLSAPDSASPILSGYDAMLFLNEGRLVEGKLEHGLHEQVSGTVLLFSSAETKEVYERDYERNTKALKVVLRNAGIEQ